MYDNYNKDEGEGKYDDMGNKTMRKMMMKIWTLAVKELKKHDWRKISKHRCKKSSTSLTTTKTLLLAYPPISNTAKWRATTTVFALKKSFWPRIPH
jgi:hypothetical protein